MQGERRTERQGSKEKIQLAVWAAPFSKLLETQADPVFCLLQVLLAASPFPEGTAKPSSECLQTATIWENH